ncbi:helix-turn-helix transcriptional regulator [Burkholderia ubonensis]|uniref:helix-turn-helix transcriptional regulator n=1 Tax=Burkholderia ubonensis TaxID=101571 RepID=UPI002ABE7D9D|nr:helix-turn-helix transcriptional regulator [Burkholderia ubonensis]
MLDNIILSIGRPEFGDVLFDAFRREMRVRQVVLFKFSDPSSIASLAARDDRDDHSALLLVQKYFTRYHAFDPFRKQCTAAPTRNVKWMRFTVREIAEDEYSQRMFVEPGIVGKLSVIVQRPDGAICLSLYRDKQEGDFCADDLNVIDNVKAPLAAAIERHAELTPASRAQNLMHIGLLLQSGRDLSQREAQVCARIVSGYSNEAIALDLVLSVHSVRTYRKRAYWKLGVTSQNELFSIILNAERGASRLTQ